MQSLHEEATFITYQPHTSREKKRELHSRFQFGWIGSPELANSIAMSELSLPHLLVFNSSTSQHHVPDDDPVLMTREAVAMFLDQVHRQMAPVCATFWLDQNNRWLFFLVAVINIEGK